MLPHTDSYLTNRPPYEPVGRHAVLVPHLGRCLRAQHRHPVLKLFTRSRRPAVGQRVWEQQVLGQQPQLAQHRALVPRDVLVVEPVAADVDHGRERNLGLETRGRNSGKTK